MREIFLKTDDNVNIAINHYNSGRNEVIIIAHGWYMCKDSKVFKAMSEDFFRYQDVITMDFRGHGRSSGFFTFSSKEPNDLKAVVDYAKTKYSRINLIGFSLGAATSIIHTAKHNDINSLVAVSAPVSFEKIENHFFKRDAYLATLKKFELWRSLTIRPGNIFSKKVAPIDVIQDIDSIPVLFVAGEKDPTIYPWHAQELYNKACEPRAIINFKAAHAEDIYLKLPVNFINTCYSWFNSATDKQVAGYS